MMSSNDFKKIATIEFLKDSLYTWRVRFDIMKYEIEKDLK